MSGTKAGGRKAAAANKERYGDDFYRMIGSKGGQNGNTGGFANDRELARRAGAIGGRMSSRAGISTGEGKSNQPKEYLWRAGDELFPRKV